ncbi:Fe(3+)-transporting ATPase [Planktothrix paucivesiculata PCC 9631]|uniref:ABC-type quaternary amine transporter n=2 Tax=Planktothrix TaxID=54304 RepID=A0A7Z9DYH7_9CYAN|nr:Fe(3+)-transporting ATPase [Planktothrix paucivesiculata PCC 9631]
MIMALNPSVIVEFCQVNYQIDQRFLIEKLNLKVYQGETLVLLGRSGSGKTTTLKLVNHLLTPTDGEVLVEGKSTHQWDLIQLRRQTGYVIQDVGLFPHFTVEQNIALVPKLQQWNRDRIQERVYQLLHLVNLDPAQFAHRYPQELSGGQRQRVGVARALAADPPLLLMDEPFGSLDPITRLELQREFRRLQQQLGKTIIFVTHDIQEAFLLASRIGLMQYGQLVFLGTPTDFKQSEHAEAQAFLECLKLPT